LHIVLYKDATLGILQRDNRCKIDIILYGRECRDNYNFYCFNILLLITT